MYYKGTDCTGIYQIINQINKKSYVGYAKNISQRWSNHKRKLRNNKHSNEHLQAAWNKYGENNFTFSVLQKCREEELCYLEHYWAIKLDVHKTGYNIEPTNPLGKNKTIAESTRTKISKAAKLQKRNPMSQETKDKISNRHIGRVVTNIWKENILKGRAASNLIKRRKVQQFNLNLLPLKSWNTILEASKDLLINSGTLYKVCKKEKEFKGFIYKFYE